MIYLFLLCARQILAHFSPSLRLGFLLKTLATLLPSFVITVAFSNKFFVYFLLFCALMEPPQECCRKRERAEGEMTDMTLAKRHYSDYSSESESFSEFLCKDEEDNLFSEDNVDADLVSDIMKSLADEIMSGEQSGCSGSVILENSNSKSVSNVDLEYLLGATDDELGIPPSPNTEDQVCSAAENPVADLLDNLKPESIEEPFHLCSSECCCVFEEQDGTSCIEWLTTSLNPESCSDQETPPL